MPQTGRYTRPATHPRALGNVIRGHRRGLRLGLRRGHRRTLREGMAMGFAYGLSQGQQEAYEAGFEDGLASQEQRTSNSRSSILFASSFKLTIGIRLKAAQATLLPNTLLGTGTDFWQASSSGFWRGADLGLRVDARLGMSTDKRMATTMAIGMGMQRGGETAFGRDKRSSTPMGTWLDFSALNVNKGEWLNGPCFLAGKSSATCYFAPLTLHHRTPPSIANSPSYRAGGEGMPE